MVRLAIVTVLVLCSHAFGQSNNGAPLYKAAFEALGYPPYGSPNSALISQEDRDFVGNLGPALSQGDRMRLDAILLKAGPAIAQLDEASRARRADWQLDRSTGFDMTLPHLQAMRSATRLMRARATLAVNDVSKGSALESLSALGRMSAHAGQDRVAISSLVGSAISSVFVLSTDLAIDGGAIDKSNAQQLLDAVSSLKRPDPFGYADAVRGEYGMLAAEFSKPKSADEIAELLGGRKLTQEEADQLASPERVQSMLRQAKDVYERAAVAMANPDPTTARRELKEISAAVESGRGGRGSDLLKLFMPSLEQMYESKLRSEQNLAVLLGRLQAIADGEVSEAELLNAALLLYRASMTAGSTSADAQDSFELLRVAPAALDTLTLERTVALLDRAEPTVMGLLAQAAPLKRCDFAVLHMPAPSLDVALLGGLRAATRMTLAQGLHRARTLKDASLAGPPIATVFRAATLLSSDATFARAHVAQSIWNEAATALADAFAIGPMNEEAIWQVERALSTMPAQDAFGWRKAFDVAIKALIVHDTRSQSLGMTPEVQEMRERVLRQRGASSAFSRVAIITAGRGSDDRLPSPDDAVLERLTDLWPATAVDAVKAAHATERAANDAAGGSAVGPSALDVPLDLPLEEQRTQLRKRDPARGVVFIDVPATQSAGVAVYTRPFDVLKARPQPARDAAPAVAPPAR
jgi:hypothetical protein